MNFDECCKCEGIFARGEKIIEVNGNRYCEVCHKETIENKL